MKPVRQKNVIEIQPSRLLGLFLCATHLSALTAVIDCALQYPLCWILTVPLLWNWIRARSLHAVLTDRNAIARVEWGADDAWTLIERRGRQISARPVERNFVAPWMTLLSFTCQTGCRRRHIILLADNSDADQVRRLRVRLRLSGSDRSH